MRFPPIAEINSLGVLLHTLSFRFGSPTGMDGLLAVSLGALRRHLSVTMP